ncbi:MAG TPA: hypothetical protein VNR60_02905 [Croceibacterium sp.]|nr:hypothetical protein [Croceibacterium sp.]
MSRFPILALLAGSSLALGACSGANEGESADDFAARVGGQSVASGVPAAVETTAVAAPPPAGVDVLALEQLGNIGGVDLGPRDGGCTFASGETELMIAGAPADPASAGRGVIRLGGKLYQLSSAGGLNALRQGTRFSGEGVTVDVAGSGQAATLTVTDGGGRQKAVAGSWVCA